LDQKALTGFGGLLLFGSVVIEKENPPLALAFALGAVLVLLLAARSGD